MNKIRVIDLLNKIANGEEVPKKIKYKGHIYQYQYKDTKEANIINYYHSEETHHHLIDGGWHDIRLNDEVEIIEEDKKIKKITVQDLLDLDTGSLLKRIVDNQNELIDEVNTLKERE